MPTLMHREGNILLWEFFSTQVLKIKIIVDTIKFILEF